jgi:hypothetical protein
MKFLFYSNLCVKSQVSSSVTWLQLTRSLIAGGHMTGRAEHRQVGLQCNVHSEKTSKKYQAATGALAPQPKWYHTYAPVGVYGRHGGGTFDSFQSALSSSIGAYSATQRSSGGGGGGSGGGSW